MKVRLFSSLIDPGARLKPSNVTPDRLVSDRLASVYRSACRRIDDDVKQTFNRACLSNDLDVATDLLALLEKLHARREGRHRGKRQFNDDTIQRARRKLKDLRAHQTARGRAGSVLAA